jgi:hypothetical protein
MIIFDALQGSEDVITLLPRRKGMPDDQPLLIVTATMVKGKALSGQGENFYFLLQSELGDVYEVTQVDLIIFLHC